MGNAKTEHSRALRSQSAKASNQRIREEGERVNGGFFDDDAKTLRELKVTHGNNVASVRFLLKFWREHGSE